MAQSFHIWYIASSRGQVLYRNCLIYAPWVNIYRALGVTILQIIFPLPDTSAAIIPRQDVARFAATNLQISDIVVVSHELVSVSDDEKVQLIDTRVRRVVSKVKMPNRPRRQCLTRSGQLAVTMGGKKVQMINIHGQTLTKTTVLDVKKQPWGITSVGHTSFALSYKHSPWLEVIATDGTVLHQFNNEGTTQPFKYPYFLTSDEGYVYVSDRITNKITKLNFSLQLLQTFSSRLLSWPRGIVSISPDQLLVCSLRNHRIVLLNTSTGKSSILLGEQDGIEYPRSLSYCPKQKKLYVAKLYTDSLAVYTL